jgi:hypothetical protein
MKMINRLMNGLKESGSMSLFVLLKIVEIANRTFAGWKLYRANYWVSSKGEPCMEVQLKVQSEMLILKFRLTNGAVRMMDARVLTKSQVVELLGKDSDDGIREA